MDDSFLCRKEGFRAFIKGKGSRKDANPYTEGTAEHKQYDLGWWEAKALCGVNAMTKAKRPPTPTPSIN